MYYSTLILRLILLTSCYDTVTLLLNNISNMRQHPSTYFLTPFLGVAMESDPDTDPDPATDPVPDPGSPLK